MMKFNFFRMLVSVLVFGLMMIPSFAGNDGIIGAGATFPYPLYSKMFDIYHKEFDIKVNYQAIGSGGGQRQISAQTVDFAGSDAFMKDEQLKKIQGKMLHIPMVLGAVSVAHNLPGVSEINLTAELVADIFLGKITKWNDSKIVAVNEGVKLPNLKITVVHRSDGSGTTAIFTDYLAKVSREWKKNVGAGKSVKWPVGIGGKGNAGVAGYLKKIKGGIAYLELAYASQNRLHTCAIQNKSGNFVKPSILGVSYAADVELPDDTRVSITDTEAKLGYPISGFTWILVYQEQHYGKRTKKQAEMLVTLLFWMTHDGQKYAEPLDYAPLSKKAQEKAETIIESIQFDGKKVGK